MTSQKATNAFVPTASTKYFTLKADKNGIPIDLQVPRTSEIYSGGGDVTIIPNGSSNFVVSAVLDGVLTLNCSNVSNFIGRNINILVRPGTTENVVINFPSSGYTVYNVGAAAAVTSYTITAGDNAQRITIEFMDTIAFIYN